MWLESVARRNSCLCQSHQSSLDIQPAAWCRWVIYSQVCSFTLKGYIRMQKGWAANQDNNYLLIFMALQSFKLLAFFKFSEKQQEQGVFLVLFVLDSFVPPVHEELRVQEIWSLIWSTPLKSPHRALVLLRLENINSASVRDVFTSVLYSDRYKKWMVEAAWS